MNHKKENIYLNLGKLSEEEIKDVGKVIFRNLDDICEETIDDLVDGIVTQNYKYLFFDNDKSWNQNETPLSGRTEITYPEFIKIFEGGEGEIQTYTKEDVENAYRAGENKQTYYFKDTTVILPDTYEGIDG